MAKTKAQNEDREPKVLMWSREQAVREAPLRIISYDQAKKLGPVFSAGAWGCPDHADEWHLILKMENDPSRPDCHMGHVGTDANAVMVEAENVLISFIMHLRANDMIVFRTMSADGLRPAIVIVAEGDFMARMNHLLKICLGEMTPTSNACH